MSTKIEWVKNPDGSPGETWNISTGCTKVSDGCKNCYAERMSKRLKAMGVKKYRNGFKLTVHEDSLADPLHWRKPRMIFVNSMSDLFHDDVPFEFIDRVFAIMALCSKHTFQVLTKRPEWMAEYLIGRRKPITEAMHELGREIEMTWTEASLKRSCYSATIEQMERQETEWPLHNVWIGTSCEDQATADERIPHLLKYPAAVRFLSLEPLLDGIDLSPQFLLQHAQGVKSVRGEADLFSVKAKPHPRIDWVIVGGESGPGARPMHPQWARDIRDQCVAAGVPFFFKQWGEWSSDNTASDRIAQVALDGWWAEGHGPCGYGSEHPGSVQVWRVGKKKAGRILDGRTWDQMPEVAG